MGWPFYFTVFKEAGDRHSVPPAFPTRYEISQFMWGFDRFPAMIYGRKKKKKSWESQTAACEPCLIRCCVFIFFVCWWRTDNYEGEAMMRKHIQKQPADIQLQKCRINMTGTNKHKQTGWTFLEGIYGEATFLFDGLEFPFVQTGLCEKVNIFLLGGFAEHKFAFHTRNIKHSLPLCLLPNFPWQTPTLFTSL